MADISKITTLDGTTYNLKDASSRDDIANLITREKSQLYNKKFLVIGDSWCSSWDGTQNLTPWATRLATNTGAITENHAFPGSGFVAKGQLNKDYSEAIQLYPGGDYDAIIIQGGVNDINAAPTDSTIETSVARFATACRTLYPHVDIYYIATALCKTLTVDNLRVLNCLIQNAKINNFIICTDLFEIGLIDSSYKGDNLHPSDAGYTEFARCVAQFLTGGDATPKKNLRYTSRFTELLSRHTVTAVGNITLTADVSLFDILIVCVHCGPSDADVKTFFVPKTYYEDYYIDISWTATNSLNWYIQLTADFNSNIMHINKRNIKGFSSVDVAVYGINFG